VRDDSPVQDDTVQDDTLRYDTASNAAESSDKLNSDLIEPGVASIWVAAALSVAGFLWFQLAQLRVGFRTDESLSMWVSSDGIGDTISRAQRFQGNSPVYFSFVWLWRQIVGDGEFILRLPSVLAIVATCLVLVHFGRELGSTHMGMAAAVVLLSAPGVMAAATTVRPYSFLLLFAVLSSRALWWWLSDRGTPRHGIVWAVTLVLAVAMSPFAAALGFAHAVALAQQKLRGRSFPPRLVPSIALAAVLSLPLVPQVLTFFLNRESFVLADQPRPLPVLALLVPFLALVIVAITPPGTAFKNIASNHANTVPLFWFFLAWSALPILALYAAGTVAGSPVFLERYRIVAVVGGALLVGLLVRNLEPLGKHVAVIALALFAVWAMADVDIERDGWREAFAWAESQTDAEQDRVLALNPSLVETFDFDILDDPEWVDYLGAHADTYDFEAPRFILPRADPSPELLEQRVSELFVHEVVVVVGPSPPGTWIDELTQAAAEAGYSQSIGPDSGFIGVAIFERP